MKAFATSFSQLIVSTICYAFANLHKTRSSVLSKQFGMQQRRCNVRDSRVINDVSAVSFLLKIDSLDQ